MSPKWYWRCFPGMTALWKVKHSKRLRTERWQLQWLTCACWWVFLAHDNDRVQLCKGWTHTVCKICFPPVTEGESGAQTDSRPSQDAFLDYPRSPIKKCHKKKWSKWEVISNKSRSSEKNRVCHSIASRVLNYPHMEMLQLWNLQHKMMYLFRHMYIYILKKALKKDSKQSLSSSPPCEREAKQQPRVWWTEMTTAHCDFLGTTGTH